MFQQLGVVMRHQIALGVAENSIRAFVRRSGNNLGIERRNVHALLLTLPEQVAHQHESSLEVYRSSGSRLFLRDVQATRPADVLTGVFIPSELELQCFPNVLLASPDMDQAQACGNRRLLAGRLYITNYRVVFHGRPYDGSRHRHKSPATIRSVPVAAVTRVGQRSLREIGIDTLSGWRTKAVVVTSGTFQELWILCKATAQDTVAQLATRLRQATGMPLAHNSFAMFTAEKLPRSAEEGSAARMKMTTAVRRALSVRTNKSREGEEYAAVDGISDRDSALVKALPEDTGATLWADHSLADAAPPPGMVVDGENVGTYLQDLTRLGLCPSEWGFLDEAVTVRSKWMVTRSNSSYAVCASYPPVLLLPWAGRHPATLEDVASHFQGHRLPVITWADPGGTGALLRAGRPVSAEAAIYSGDAAAAADELADYAPGWAVALQAIAAASQPVDASVSSEVGGVGSPAATTTGAEHCFLLCDNQVLQECLRTEAATSLSSSWQFLSVEEGSQPIVTAEAAQSFATPALVSSVVMGRPSISLSDLEKTGWMQQTSALLHWSSVCADILQLKGGTLLVALERGWAQTAQIVSLTQLLVDEHYRTIAGFSELIRKEWLAMGHPFGKARQPAAATAPGAPQAHTPASGSPAFVEFLHATYQLLVQFPSQFEFSSFFLEALAYHGQSMRFGTFCHGSERERGEVARDYSVSSVWAFLDHCHQKSPHFFNFLYQPSSPSSPATVVRPHAFLPRLQIWPFLTDGAVSADPRP